MSLWRSGPQVLGEYGSKPQVSLPRRLPAVCSGYRHHALHISAREAPWFSLSSSAPRPTRTTPSSQAGARIEQVVACCAPRRPLLAVGRVCRGPTFHLRIEHFQGSAAGVDLIVMREIGKAFENA